MIQSKSVWPLALYMAVAFTSCSEDPEMVAKREKQRAEIIQLKGDLALIDEKLKDVPPDVSDELRETKKQAEEASTKVSELEREVATLETNKRALQDEFDAYRIKYQAK